jgi:hypothetical protein
LVEDIFIAALVCIIHTKNVLHGLSIVAFQDFVVLSEDIPKFVEVFQITLLKNRVVSVCVYSPSQTLDEVVVHLELVYTLKLNAKSVKSTLMLVFVNGNLIFFDLKLAYTTVKRVNNGTSDR